MTTNPTIEQMLAHRSIRAYADDPIPRDDIETAVRAGQMAATSSAVQAYCVIRVAEPSARRRIAELTGPQEKVRLAPEFFVICGDSRRHRLVGEREGRAYDTRLEAFLVAVIDASLFAQNMALAFESMGYGCCYIGGLRNDLPEVDRVLELPEGVYPLYGLCVGRPAQDPGARPRLSVEGVLFEDRYPSDEQILRVIDEYDSAYEAYLRERGAEPAPWSARMATLHAEPRRTVLAEYYRGKGAVLS